MEELEEKVRGALRGTSNRSTPGPDGISYRFIKMVLDTKLGRELIREVAMTLREGRIPRWPLYRRRIKIIRLPKDGGRLTSSTALESLQRKLLLMSCRRRGYSTKASTGH